MGLPFLIFNCDSNAVSYILVASAVIEILVLGGGIRVIITPITLIGLLTLIFQLFSSWHQNPGTKLILTHFQCAIQRCIVRICIILGTMLPRH